MPFVKLRSQINNSDKPGKKTTKSAVSLGIYHSLELRLCYASITLLCKFTAPICGVTTLLYCFT
jgi:hypothetical protein